MIEESLFPYENFPVRLEQKTDNRICWFKDDYDLQKYLIRYKLDKRKIKIDYRDGEPVLLSKRNKRSVEQTPKPKSNRSSGSSKRRTAILDSSSHVSCTKKSKK